MNLFGRAIVVAILLAVASRARAESVCAWTNVAGEVTAGAVVSVNARSVYLAKGAVTQRVARSAFPASEIARMQAALGAVPEARPPAAIAPAWDDFAAKCAADQVTRSELVALLGFIAGSALDEAAKAEWTRKARERYRASYKRSRNLKGVEK